MEKKKKIKKKPTLVTKFVISSLAFEVHANNLEWILLVGTKHRWYYSSLDSLLEDLFEFLQRERLGNGRNTSFETIIRITKETRKEVLELLAPFKNI